MSRRKSSTLKANGPKGSDVWNGVGLGLEQDVERRVEAERLALLREKQAVLDRIEDRHDDLIREAFHLEKFRTLVAYDPKDAKRDTSAVFQEFKARYDLIGTAASSAVSSRRTTRRAHHERVELLKGPIATSASTAPSTSQKSPSVSSDTNHVIWDILVSKGKGKEKEKVERETRPPKPNKGKAVLKGTGHGETHASASAPVGSGKPRGKGKTRSAVPEPLLAQIDSVDPLDRYLARVRGRSPHLTGETPLQASDFMPPPRKRRKTDSVTVSSLRESASADALSSSTSKRRPSRQPLVPPEPDSKPSSSAKPLGPTSSIKRIRLIVREPIPSFTNPKQKASPPLFGKSLTALLSAYHTLEGPEVELPRLDEVARKDAAFMEQVSALRKQGRLLLRADLASAADRNVPSPEQQRGIDIWDHIIEAVRNRRQQSDITGRDIAASIASKVRAYWDVQNAKEGKVKLQEEKRLRALAKATMKMVISDWKKAVFHIREQERLRREEEESRRGREHLDAILDQSGQILETQHIDLSRAGRSRSRSSSVSATLRDLEDADEDEEDESGQEGELHEEDGAAEEGDISEGEEQSRHESETTSVADETREEDSDDEEVEDLTALLGDHPLRSVSNGESASPRSGFSDEVMHDDLDFLTSYDAPSAHADDAFSPSSDLVETPASDHPVASPSASPLVESSRNMLSSETPSIKLDIPPPALPHPYDDTFFHMEDDGDAVAVTPFPQDQSSMQASCNLPFVDPHSEHASLNSLGSGSEILAQASANDTDPAANQQHPDIDTANILRISPPSPDGTETPLETPAESVSGSLLPTPITGADEELPEVEERDEDVIDTRIPRYLRPYAVAPVEWDTEEKIKPPILLRGVLRPYQQAGLEWLASIHTSNLNGILADEMGLGKTIQTIALLAHLACDRGIWGPHLIIVPTSVLLNWEMEFKKFLPGFKVLAYHGPTKRRKELRQGWYDKFGFNVCITSYTLASRDAHIFKRKPWYYMILDEAHMIKNFKSQRWNILLMFRSFRRLLLTGTPLQNNLTELWALLQFLVSGTNFANLKEFGEWFANPLEKAIEMGTALDDETQQRVSKLHTVLRPYLLRRLKRDVEKELPSKYEHLVLCPLSKRQRFLYDEFMSRAQTRNDLDSGVYQKIANILMQLRKVCNHPDLFEVRPIVTSFAMDRSAIADFEIKELLVRRRLLRETPENSVNLDVLGLRFIERQNTSLITSLETRRLDGTSQLPFVAELPGEPPPYDTRTVIGFKKYRDYQQHAATVARWTHVGYLNRLRCGEMPIYSSELLRTVQKLSRPLLPSSALERSAQYLDTVEPVHAAIKSYAARAEEMAPEVNIFACITPAVVAHDLPRRVLAEIEGPVHNLASDIQFDAILHQASVKRQIAFPDLSLLQYDCGKLQELARLLRERKAGGHRILIFTQMTKILDILEMFLNFHGYLYLRLDGATRIEDRQYITERFNADPRIFCFIASSRSGGVGINLTGADTVIFYDSDFNPQMDRQCEDRAHRIGQIRDVHIYRFISQHTVEEAMLRKANQKRSLDDLVIQKGEFDWRSLLHDVSDMGSEGLTKALQEFEDTEDAYAAKVAAEEEGQLEGADEADFGEDSLARRPSAEEALATPAGEREPEPENAEEGPVAAEEQQEDEEGGTTVEYMLAFVQFDYDFFRDWRL
ncbi:hypothetical protein BV25DRAFT_1904841 [Artomyces pyxidatus]|uniref:Uncharacterized protein n=1 Tax=Artomyces pyxidatus TaxID=48021 RepID=A0ACB8TGQ4_9AGAM|nr:hypothetical protein BV25DRAFT_1904841 [Artomyces pyxidatus]